MGIYDKYIHELPKPFISPGEHRNIRVMDADGIPVMTHHFEVMMVYKDGADEHPGFGFEVGSQASPADQKKHLEESVKRSAGPGYRTEDGRYVVSKRPMYHTVDETFLFFGTDLDHPEDLGGEIELWIGLGDRAEKHVITKPSAVFIPAGLVHCPMVFRKVRRLIFEVVCFDGPHLVEHGVDEWPPEYRPPTPTPTPHVDLKRTKLAPTYLPK